MLLVFPRALTGCPLCPRQDTPFICAGTACGFALPAYDRCKLRDSQISLGPLSLTGAEAGASGKCQPRHGFDVELRGIAHHDSADALSGVDPHHVEEAGSST